MDYTQIITVATQITILAGLIALVVSLLMEFLIKKLFKLTTMIINIVIVALSEALTILCGVIYAQVKQYTPDWYVWVGVVFLGFLVSIISMNGYDKIYSYIYNSIKDMFKNENK